MNNKSTIAYRINTDKNTRTENIIIWGFTSEEYFWSRRFIMTKIGVLMRYVARESAEIVEYL